MQNVEAFYQWSSGYHSSQLGMGDGAYDLLAKERARKIQPWIARQHRIFEYGVGTALNLAGVKCRERYGWDIGAHLRPDVERLGIRWVASMEEIPDASFDVVICHHVLEHVSEPGSVLQTLYRILRPDGALLLFVPYERERRYRQFDAAEPNHHLYSWNPQTLGNLLSAGDFQVESVGLGSYGYERFAAEQVSRWGGEWIYRATLRILRAIRPVQEVRLVARKPK